MRHRFASLPRGQRAAAVIVLALCAAIALASARPGAALAAEETAELAASAPRPAHGASNPHAASAASGAADAAPPNAPPIPPETATVTEHSLRIDGRQLEYTATAGNILLRDDEGEPEASVFYVAYTVHSKTKHAAARPVTFLFNGGPGAASIFLLIGSVGPKRVRTASPAATPPAPYTLADNPDSLLDKSDLVFVDAVGTGFSKPVGRASGKRFWNVDGDLEAFSRFIDRYLSVYQRWNSPKFVAGESYGAARAAMLAYRLNQRQIALNGVVLLSSVLNSNVLAPGYDLASVRYLPSYAAIAWYHDKIKPARPADLPAFLDEVRAFAAGPYAAALAKGDALPDSERDAIAAQLARYTGLDASYLSASRLRVRPARFRKELLRSEARSVGRYDGRFKGIDSDTASDAPEFDATEKYITSAFDAAFHQHLAQDLHYVSDERYRVFSDDVTDAWSWKHREWWGETLNMPYAAGDLAQAMRQNPRLRVLSANGYYDLATPFFSTEYDLSHMGLEPSLRANVRITYYASGHMIYLDDAALHALKTDWARFYDAATASGE
ncbi:MAG TPA: peptidase S10 [Trinickia sp.]|nr:peptidase S10 [Trinickia sp.]